MALSTRHVRLILYGIVFCSGFSGLVYEVIWVRMLHTILGCTTYAVCLVLAAFMGGLALGSFSAGRLIEGKANALRIYALIEAGIGLFALISPLLLNALNPIYVWLHGQMPHSQQILSAIRFLLAFAVLVIPTSLMGATLPVLAHFFVKKRSGMGADIGGIYGFNTIGATAGCFLTGFFLIEAIGIRWTIILAAFINLSAAAFVLVLSGRFATIWRGKGGQESVGTTKVTQEVRSHEAYSGSLLRIVLLAFAISGFISLGYEVLWTKAISFFAGNTSYAFSTMLTTFLLGIGLGSLIVTRFCDKMRSLVAGFGLAEILIGLCAIGSIPMFAHLFYQIEPASFGGSEATPVGLKFTYSFIVMLLPTLLMGAIFPIVGKIYTRSLKKVGRSIGDIYSVNTVAGILGSAIAGFVLVPTLGIQKGILLLAAANIAVGFALVALSPDAARSRKYALLVPVVLLTVILTAITPVSSNTYTTTKRPSMPEGNAIYYEEGVTHIVEIIESQNGTRHLMLDGGINASTASIGVGTRVHMMMAQLPLLLHHDPRSILLIALGSGMTAGATLAFDNLETIDCAEISPDVVRAAGYFRKWNHDVVNDPRFNLHIEDGRNFVLTAQQKYDVITTGIIHPKYNSGNASLYSSDYYELCRSRLKEGGIICQWAPLNGLTVREFKTILGTFQKVFPNSSLWFAQTFGSFGNSNALLVGSIDKIGIDYGVLESRLRNEKIASDLQAEGVGDIIEFLDCFAMGERTLAEYVGETEITTDDRPVLEFGKVEMHYPEILADIISRRESVWPYLEITSEDSSDIFDAFRSQFEVSGRCIQGDLAFLLKNFNTAIAQYSSARLMAPNNSDVYSQYMEVQARALKHIGKKLAGTTDMGAANIREYLKNVRINPDDTQALYGMGFLCQNVGWLDAAIGQYREALNLEPDELRVRNNLAVVYDLKGWSDKALEELESVIKGDPSFAEPYAYAGYIHERLGNREKAIELYEKALEIDPSSKSAAEHLSALK